MIRGTFINGRPFVVGRVLAGSIDPDGMPTVHAADIPFLVDTGADRTMLSPFEFETRLGLSLLSTPVGVPSSGVGGSILPTRVQSGVLLLRHDDDISVSLFRLEFMIPEPLPGAPGLGISLLGRNDVILQGTLTMNSASILLDLPTVI